MKKEKILLGTSKNITSENVDNYINIQLSRETDFLLNDKFNNTFDYSDQYNIERNKSLKFGIYGIVDSKYGSCHDVKIDGFIGDSNNPFSQKYIHYNPYITQKSQSAYTFNIVTDQFGDVNSGIGNNIYYGQKGIYQYLFEVPEAVILNRLSKSVYLNIRDEMKELYGSIEIPIIFFTEDGEFIDYGNNTIEVSDSGEIIEKSNDFPFFYNRHWVKTKLNLIGPASIKFDTPSITVNVDEKIGVLPITISLSRPSLYGAESFKLKLKSLTSNDLTQFASATLIEDFNFQEFSYTFSATQQTFTYNLEIIDDKIVENIELLKLELIPLEKTYLLNDEDGILDINIISDDLPSAANYKTNRIEVTEPDIRLMSYVDVPITIDFSKPIEIINQTIGISINTGSTTAELGTAYLLDIDNITASTLSLKVDQGKTDITFNLRVFANTLNDIDRYIQLDLIQETTNIKPGSLYPSIKITIKDFFIQQFVRYNIPFNPTRGYGVYKMIYNTSNQPQLNPVYWKLGSFSGDSNPNKTNPYVTNNFKFNIKVINIGDQVVINNELIKNGESYNFEFDSSTQSEIAYFDLPTNTNFDSVKYSYDKCMYKITFDDISNTIPDSVNTNQSILKLNSFSTEILSDITVGGNLGFVNKYMTSEISDIITMYNEIDQSCANDSIYLNSNIKINGALLVPKNGIKNLVKTNCTTKFSDTLVLDSCEFNNDNLPVGTQIISAETTNKKFTQVNFGELFFQSGINSQAGINLRLNVVDNLTKYNSTNVDLYSFAGAFTDSRNSLKLTVQNKGQIPVTVANKLLTPGSMATYDNTEINFENPILIFPTNSGFNLATKSFEIAHYNIQFKNAKLYDTSGVFTQKVINTYFPDFKLTGETFLNIPTYYLQTYYGPCMVRQTCNSNTFTYVQKVRLKGYIFEWNASGTIFNTNYNGTDVNAVCNNGISYDYGN